METDVARGFGFIITKSCAAKLKGAEIYPISLQHQWTINEEGKSIPKKRVCHDQSNNKKLGLSVNQRCNEDDIPDVAFGWTLQRVLHMIHHLRLHHPNKRILMNKVDIEKAYRRLHISGDMAAKTIATWHLPQDESDEDIAVALGRLPFGSVPAPSEFSNCSDITFDLAKDLMDCEEWDPDVLPCPLRDEIPPPHRLPDNVPFGQALDSDVHLPPSFKGGTDGYIDDGCNVVLDSDDNQPMVQRAEQNIPMALHLQFRPHGGDQEPIPRGEMASIPKLKAEAFLTEILIFLGWEINSRAFEISLPEDKFIAWSTQIREVIATESVTGQTMESLIGRLNHAAYIIPAARHFMNRLRQLEMKARKYRKAKVTSEVRKDLHLWLNFLTKAKEGISINNVVYRSITSQNLSDSSEFGIGGYGIHSGVAWRYKLSEMEQISFDINQKEYIASAVNQWIQLRYDESPFPCSNDITDNTSTAAWMYKSNFDPESRPINNEVARFNAQNLMDNNATCYSQHMPGAMNVIADSLSRDFHLTNNQLISLFEHIKSPCLPNKKMTIIDLPEEITSWIASLAQLQPKKRELSWGHTPSTLALGILGWSGSTTSEQMTPYFKNSTHQNEYASCAPSYTPSDEVTSLPTGIQLKGIQRRRPSITWRRPSSQVVGSTPALTPPTRRASS